MPFNKERILVKIVYSLKGHCKKLQKEFPSKRYNQRSHQRLLKILKAIAHIFAC